MFCTLQVAVKFVEKRKVLDWVKVITKLMIYNVYVYSCEIYIYFNV